MVDPYDFSVAVSQGAQGFIQGMKDLEDRKMKQMELEALKKSREDESKRNQLLDAIAMRKAGLMQGSGGELVETPEAMEERQAKLESLRNPRSDDPFGIKALTAMRLKSDFEKSQRAQTPEGKIQALSGEQKMRLDNVVGALNALTSVEAAFEDISASEGGKVRKKSQMVGIPFRGDTKYTSASSRFEEFLGRLQSGGAITKDEEIRFRRLIPTAFDSEDVARSKISEMRAELSGMLENFGLDINQAKEMGKLRDPRGLLSPSGLVSQQGMMTQKSNAQGQTKTYKGKTYELRGDEWVEVK